MFWQVKKGRNWRKCVELGKWNAMMCLRCFVTFSACCLSLQVVVVVNETGIQGQILSLSCLQCHNFLSLWDIGIHTQCFDLYKEQTLVSWRSLCSMRNYSCERNSWSNMHAFSHAFTAITQSVGVEECVWHLASRQHHCQSLQAETCNDYYHPFLC